MPIFRKAPKGLSLVQIGRLSVVVELMKKLNNPIGAVLADRIAGQLSRVQLRELVAFWTACYQLLVLFQMAIDSERPVADFRDELYKLFKVVPQ